MEISFTLWSVREIIEKLPFDFVVTGDAIHLDLSQLAVPYYLKCGFKISIFYKDDSFPVDAACLIYSPKNIVTVVIIIKKKYEESLKSWLDTHDEQYLENCCRRRELYSHETTHLIAIVRAYPSDRSSKAREDFIKKLHLKFDKSINDAQNSKAVPFVSMENPGDSPSVFNKDHFRYDDDSLNYFKLYQELMLPYENMIKAISPLVKIYDSTGKISFTDLSKETFVTGFFFDLFPEKLTTFRELLAENLFK